MTGFVSLVRALGMKRLLILKRYPIDTAGQVITVAILFLALFVGGRSLAGPTLGGSLGAVVVGYFLWTMAMGAYSSLAGALTAETQWGTFEQLYLAPRRIEVVTGAMATVFLLETFLWGTVILGFMLVVTGVTLHIDLVTIVIVGLLSLGSAVGVGFCMGGLVIRYKRITSVLGLLQFAFIGFIAAPVGTFPVLHALPLTTGTHLLRLSMEEGVGFWEFPPELIVLLVLKAGVYLVLGMLVLRVIVDDARHRGVIGHY